LVHAPGNPDPDLPRNEHTAAVPDGFSLAARDVPESLQALGYIFPSDFAIDGIVRIDQLGASLWDVVRDWRGLWGRAVIYFALAAMSAFLAKRRQVHG
jgi:ABC-2 type transport system permease protein